METLFCSCLFFPSEHLLYLQFILSWLQCCPKSFMACSSTIAPCPEPQTPPTSPHPTPHPWLTLNTFMALILLNLIPTPSDSPIAIPIHSWCSIPTSLQRYSSNP